MTDRNRRRLLTVVLAPAAAAAAWGIIRSIGVDLELEGGGGTVGPLEVVAAALAAALGGWLVVRLLERHTRRPGSWWVFLATTALSVSVIGPTWRADGASAVALIALHVVTAVVVIAGFAGTLPVRCDDRCRPANQPWPESKPSR